MTRLRTTTIAAAVGALLITAGCSGSSAPAPAPPDPLAGEIREFRMLATPSGGHPRARIWLLDEDDGAHRSRTMSTAVGEDAWDTSLQVTRRGGEEVVRRQVLLGPDGARGVVHDTGTLPLSGRGAEANADPGFFRRLVRLGIATPVGSVTGGCRDYSAPLAIAASGVTDAAEAAGLGYVPTGADDRAVIRLCGAAGELRRVSTPGYRLEGVDGRVPASTLDLRLVRIRPATDALVRATFDLAVAHPGTRVSTGDTATAAP